MDLSPRTTVVSDEGNKLWLASSHGTDATDTITLDLAGGTFDALVVADTARPGKGVIPDGIPLVKSGNLYVVPANTVRAHGHLMEPVYVDIDADGLVSTHAGGALLWHGEVVLAQVTALVATFTDAATEGASLIRYV